MRLILETLRYTLELHLFCPNILSSLWYHVQILPLDYSILLYHLLTINNFKWSLSNLIVSYFIFSVAGGKWTGEHFKPAQLPRQRTGPTAVPTRWRRHEETDGTRRPWDLLTIERLRQGELTTYRVPKRTVVMLTTISMGLRNRDVTPFGVTSLLRKTHRCYLIYIIMSFCFIICEL